MKRARVGVDPPREATSAVHRAILDDDRLGDALLLSGGIDPEDPTELFSVEGPPGAVVPAVEAQSAVRSVQRLDAEGETTYLHVREAGRDATVANAFTDGTLVVTLPVRFRADGTVAFTVLGSGSDLETAVETAGEVADVSVHWIRDGWRAGGEGLTDRQRDVVEAALAAGYYDSPRTGTQEAVAERVGIAPSTVAEHLRKAEATALRWALGEQE